MMGLGKDSYFSYFHKIAIWGIYSLDFWGGGISKSRWWFQRSFSLFPLSWGKLSNLTSIFFRWLETSKQYMYIYPGNVAFAIKF